MGPAQAIETGLARSFQFSGRASRSEFWWFASFVWVITAVAFAAAVVYLGRIEDCGCGGWGDQPVQFVLLPLLSLLPVTTITALARRLRDAGLFTWHLWFVAMIIVTEVLVAVYQTFFPGSGPVGWDWPVPLRQVRSFLNFAALLALGVSYLLAILPTKPNQDSGIALPMR